MKVPQILPEGDAAFERNHQLPGHVRRAMPYTESKSLTNEEVYAVTAYLLHLNGIIGAQDVMNAQTLPQVTMPNRDNFMVVYPSKPK